MNWLTNYVRPTIKALVRRDRPDVPENLWIHCPSCERMIFHRDLDANQDVCSHCDHHFRVGPEFRFKALFDEGSWTRIELPKAPIDPLKFRDRKRYSERLKEAQSKTGQSDAIEAAHGRIGGLPAVVAVMNFDFMAGSMGVALGEGLLAAAQARGAAGGGVRRGHGVRRCAHAGRRALAHADAAQHDRDRGGQGGGAALHHDPDRSDHRRRDRLVRDAGRHRDRRARRAHRLRRPPGDRADDPREPARGFPDLGVSARARHDRHGRAPLRAARDAGAHPAHPDAAARTRQRTA